jgi:aspartyl-tRNA(Asn)/glutamyl-tRNA(Gln) amidotransferase subunit C
MKKFNETDTKKMAKLACIELSEESCKNLTEQVGTTVEWISQILDANTNGVEPLTNVHNINLRMNQDAISDGNISEQVLQNATDAKYNYFSVPKVIE